MALIDIDMSFDVSLATQNWGRGVVHDAYGYSDGRVLIAGNFHYVNGDPRGHLVRLLPDGTVDEAFNCAVFGGWVSALESTGDGRFLIGGQMTSINGGPSTDLMVIDDGGALVSAISISRRPGTVGDNRPIVRDASGKYLVRADFSPVVVDGITIDRPYFRLNADFSVDTSLTLSFNNIYDPYCMTLAPSGDYLLGGNFTQVNGQARSRLAKVSYNGVLGPFSSTINSAPENLVELPDGRILVTGAFTFVNGVNLPRCVVLNADGTTDTGFTLAAPPAAPPRLVGRAVGYEDEPLIAHWDLGWQNGGSKLRTIDTATGAVGAEAVIDVPAATVLDGWVVAGPHTYVFGDVKRFDGGAEFGHAGVLRLGLTPPSPACFWTDLENVRQACGT